MAEACALDEGMVKASNATMLYDSKSNDLRWTYGNRCYYCANCPRPNYNDEALCGYDTIGCAVCISINFKLTNNKLNFKKNFK